GIYAVTDGRHFESRAEVAMLRMLGADVVGQSMCPEVYLAREIGACYGRLDIVVNYAEGVVEDWSHEELKDIFYSEGERIGRVLLEALGNLDLAQECRCAGLRYPTLLKE
ncbi:MAG: phosphorylase family protein, partial [Desulfotomaculales bacterium]